MAGIMSPGHLSSVSQTGVPVRAGSLPLEVGQQCVLVLLSLKCHKVAQLRESQSIYVIPQSN